MEIWKDIEGYEGLYQVSNLGRIKSLRYNKEKILKPGITKRGYCIVILVKNNVKTTYTVHRLVYKAFKGELIEGLVIDHISGIKTQNNIKNLQQITNRENTVKGNRKPSGFAKPSKVTKELCDFMKRNEGTEIARTEVTKSLIEYIKENKLENKTNSKIIVPDDKLKFLLGIEDGQELTYFNIQKYMTKHFIKNIVEA